MGKKILVVDDEEMILKLLRIHLRKLGFKVREAANGTEALEILGNDNFDLLICDIKMPKKDGWQLLKEVKSNSGTKDLLIIVLNTDGGDEDVFKAYGLGAHYYMTKPFTKAQLLHALTLLFGEA
jgi:DNA-binding response OmpR family regulator